MNPSPPLRHSIDFLSVAMLLLVLILLPLAAQAGNPTQTTVTAVPQSPSQYLQLVTFTAMVTGSVGPPTGTVTFTGAEGSQLCVPVKLVAAGCGSNCSTAACSTATLPVGADAVTAAYGGDSKYNPSSGSIQYTVNGVTSTTTLTVSPPSPVVGQVVTLTAKVTNGGDPVLFGIVTFLNSTNSQVLGTVQLESQTSPAPGTATLKTRFAPGSYSVLASFNGTLDNQGSGSEANFTVTGTEPTITTLTDQANGNNWNFTASVFGFGFPAATGMATFTDLTTLVNLGSVGLQGPGLSSFQPQVTYGTGANPVGVAVGDFNGDGIPDLAIANLCISDPTCQSDSTVSILLGNGDGTFQPQQTYPTGATPVGIAVADFNGDGNADLAVANNNANSLTVSVLLGNGNGTFQPQQTYTVGSSPIGIAAADFNGDGVPDLAATNEFATSPSVSILLGGTVTSGQIQNVPVNGSGVHMIQSTYTPNQGFYTGSVSNTLNVNGNGSLIPTTTTVTSSGNPSQLNQPVTFTATVTSNSGGMPTRTVTFTNNGAALCTAVQLNGDGLAQCATSTLPVGTNAIAATYSGDQNFATSQGGLNQVVQSGTKLTPTVTLTANPLEVNQGNSVFFAVTVGSYAGLVPTGTVTFIDGTTPLATVTLDPSGDANYSNATLVVGQHSITATYNGDSNFNSATSSPVMVQVDNPFIVQSTSYSGTVSPGGQTQLQINVIAAYQSNPLIYAAISCTPPAGSGITCAVTCPHNSPSTCSVYSDSEQVTVTINTSSGTARLLPALHRSEHRVIAAFAGLSGIGLVGLVFIPMRSRRRAAIGTLFLLIVVLCFGTSCGTNFAPGISSSPVNNTFYISVTADLREELGGNQMNTRSLGVQQFWYTLLIK